MTLIFSWEDFDYCVDKISNKVNNTEYSGIYGIPRGGVCLAVSLSHKLNMKLLDRPKDNCLLVDDIFDSGETLKKYRNIKNARYFVIFSRKKPLWWESIYLIENDKWIIFPWENKDNYKEEERKYKLRRFNKKYKTDLP